MGCVKGLSQMGLVIAPPELALTYWHYFAHPEILRTRNLLMESPKVRFVEQLAAKGREVYFREFMAAADAGLVVAGAFDLPTTPPNPPQPGK
jgi:hypothetical protein